MKNHLFAASLLFLGSAAANALTFNVTSLETNADPDAPATWFGVSLTSTATTGTFEISNFATSGNSSKISEIYLGVDGFFSDFFVLGTGVVSGSGTSFSLDESLNNGQKGRSQASWLAAVLVNPAGGSDSSVINPNESLSITYDLVNGVTEADLIGAFTSDPQKLGIAFHAQSLPGGYSEKYEATPGTTGTPIQTPVPDGGATVALLGVALLGLGGTRRLMAKRS